MKPNVIWHITNSAEPKFRQIFGRNRRWNLFTNRNFGRSLSIVFFLVIPYSFITVYVPILVPVRRYSIILLGTSNHLPPVEMATGWRMGSWSSYLCGHVYSICGHVLARIGSNLVTLSEVRVWTLFFLRLMILIE